MQNKPAACVEQLAQVGPACIKADSRFQPPECSSSLVMLQVDSENRLLAAAERIQASGSIGKLGYTV
jgi:hypothetical protein